VDNAGSITVEYAAVEYAQTAIDSITSNTVQVDNDWFLTNGTAIEVTAQPGIDVIDGTNASFEENWFSGNAVAINASSFWVPTTSCFYEPTMDAWHNVYGGTSESNGSLVPWVSAGDYEEIQLWDGDTYPYDWTDEVAKSSTGDDVIQGWGVQTCYTPTNPPLPCAQAAAIPLNLESGNQFDDIPVVCETSDGSELPAITTGSLQNESNLGVVDLVADRRSDADSDRSRRGAPARSRHRTD
jgi:hypothetical protein